MAKVKNNFTPIGVIACKIILKSKLYSMLRKPPPKYNAIAHQTAQTMQDKARKDIKSIYNMKLSDYSTNTDTERLLYETLRSYGIGYPQRGVTSHGFTRWGKNYRY